MGVTGINDRKRSAICGQLRAACSTPCDPLRMPFWPKIHASWLFSVCSVDMSFSHSTPPCHDSKNHATSLYVILPSLSTEKETDSLFFEFGVFPHSSFSPNGALYVILPLLHFRVENPSW
jgi:hypothetical protein